MTDFTVLGSSRKRGAFIFILAVVIALTAAAAIRYTTPLAGIPDTEVRQLDSGWFYESNGSLSPLAQLPCQLYFTDDTLCLVRDLTDTETYPGDVLAIQTRYQSIRVWADQTLIYEAAQGQEHALSSMWHFIAAEAYSGFSTLRIQLTKYDQESNWELFAIYQDHPDAIGMHLLKTHLPAILAWLFCMLFALLLIVITLFMVTRHIAGGSLVLALTAFIFLSGTWILLDSKVTTVAGGNYALTYFFSYCVFYLLPVPLLIYFQLMLELKNRLLRYLMWITIGNAGLWMLLHLLNIVSIRNTATSVHLIIIIFLAAFVRETFRKGENRPQKRLMYTFWGIVLIFVVALLSIVLYHAGLLPPTNSAVIFVWGLLALILCMIMDTIVLFGRVWKERQYMEFYRQLATEDSMTRLANRNAYEIRLQELVSHPSGEVSMVLFDIDHMKQINDTYGHHAGDQVILLAAQCIHEVFGYSGDCYRIGGDEFCVIQTSSEDIPRKLRQFDQVMKLRNTTSFPVRVSYGWERRTFEEGISVTMKDIVELKNAADKVLYRNKNMRETDS